MINKGRIYGGRSVNISHYLAGMKESMATIRRALPWAGWTAFVLVVVAGAAYWYLSAQRMRLEDETRRELAQASRDLRSNLNELSSNAAKYFVHKNKRGDDAIQEFARRNPYVDLPTTSSNHASNGLTKKEEDRKSTRLNSSHSGESRMPSSA